MRSFAEDLLAARSHGGEQQRPSSVRKTGRAPRRSRAPIETTDFAAMFRRLLRAYAKRLADSDMEDLTEMFAVQAEFDAAVQAAVEMHRSRWDTSWAEIARAAGIPRSTAYDRWA